MKCVFLGEPPTQPAGLNSLDPSGLGLYYAPPWMRMTVARTPNAGAYYFLIANNELYSWATFLPIVPKIPSGNTGNWQSKSFF